MSPEQTDALRDIFASQALPGVMTDKRYAEAGNEAACVYEISRYCYRIADAMMEARKPAPPPVTGKETA